MNSNSASVRAAANNNENEIINENENNNARANSNFSADVNSLRASASAKPVSMNSLKPMPGNSFTSLESASLPIISSSPRNASEVIKSMSEGEGENENPVSPSNPSADLVEKNAVVKGGSLYNAISRKGGDLAAAGVLLGLAAATIRPSKGRRHTRRFKRF